MVVRASADLAARSRSPVTRSTEASDERTRQRIQQALRPSRSGVPSSRRPDADGQRRLSRELTTAFPRAPSRAPAPAGAAARSGAPRTTETMGTIMFRNHRRTRPPGVAVARAGTVRTAAVVGLVAGALALAGCGGAAEAGAAAGGGRLSLVAYSTPKEAYAELIPAFGRTAAGKGVTFTQSYGASGAQSRAVVAGLPA